MNTIVTLTANFSTGTPYPFAPWPPVATPPGLAWTSSLGERAFGCGRWASTLTEPSRPYVRSLTRAPLARSLLLRSCSWEPTQPTSQEREVCPEARETSDTGVT